MKMNNYNYFEPPHIEGEEWRDVDGYQGLYKVSNKGRLWIIKKARLMSEHSDNRNRLSVCLCKNGIVKRYVLARIVATAFIRKPNPDEEINHLDENPLNNCVENLEWCLHKYNCNYGTRIKRIAEKQSIPIIQLTLSGEFVARHASMQSASRSLGLDAGHICDACNGNREYAYGYKWRFEDDNMYNIALQNYKEHVRKSKQSRLDAFTEKALDILQYDLDGNFIAEYPSSRIAAQETGIARRCILGNCAGNTKTTHGFVFKYKYPERRYFHALFIVTTPPPNTQTQLF